MNVAMLCTSSAQSFLLISQTDSADIRPTLVELAKQILGRLSQSIPRASHSQWMSWFFECTRNNLKVVIFCLVTVHTKYCLFGLRISQQETVGYTSQVFNL
jgi:hypothetical protein